MLNRATRTRLRELLLVAIGIACAVAARLGAPTLAVVVILFGALVLLFDQNQRRKSEIGSEQARRAAIVDGTSDAIIGETLDGVITDWNRAAERLFGHRAEFALGRLAAELILPSDRAGEDANIRSLIAAGTPVPAFDTTRRRADGSLVEVSVAASPIVAPDGTQVGFSKLVRDISERKLAEARIRSLNASLEQQVRDRTRLLDTARRDLQNILDAVPSLVSYWDRDLFNRFANRAHQSWFGWDPEALPGQNSRRLAGACFEEDRHHIEAVLRGETQIVEHRISSSGSDQLRFVSAHYQPDVANGEVKGFYLFATDITKQVESTLLVSAALREKEALLGAIREYAIVSVTDDAGQIIEVNDRFCEISGYSRQELLGRDHRLLNSGSLEHSFWTEMWNTIAAGRSWRGEICNRAKDGTLYWLDSMIAPFLGADGRIEKYVSIHFDISAAKRAARALVDSQAFLDRAGKVARVGAWELDVATQQITWSAEMYRIHDLVPGSVPDLGAAIRFYPAEAREFVERTVRAAIELKKGWDFELPFTSSTGRKLWVRSVGELECDGDVPLRLVGTMQDISARREVDLARQRVEAELQKSHERTAIAADAAGIGVWEFDIENNSLVWDDWMYRLYGRSRVADDLEPYELWAGSLHPEDREITERTLELALKGEASFDGEFRIARPNGEIRHLKAAARVMRDPSGNPLRMMGVNFDITDRKRAELELRQTSAVLEAVLESASDVSLIATDPNLVIKVFNTGAERLLGYRASELVNEATPLSIHDPAEVAQHAAELSAACGEPVEGGAALVHPRALGQAREWTYLRKDGRSVPVSLVITAMRGTRGELSGYLGVAHDVTRQKHYERTLVEAMRKAEQASVAKSEFLANMSHEIRTPMNAVLGLTYLLAQTKLDSEQTTFVSQIRASGSSLLALINDILDFSKIEAGELALEHANFRFTELLRRVQNATSAQARQKRIAFLLDAQALPDELVGDCTRLEQILTNLLSNAIKFTSKGGVTLRVRAQPASPGNVRLTFEVEDTGIGIPAVAQERLFAPFAQADASTTRRFGGTGLGLSIVRRLANLMGGEVTLSSQVGRGSTFRVLVTVALPNESSCSRPGASTPLGENSLRGIRLLLVDDSELNLSVAGHVLRREGAIVSLAINGKEAVDRVVAEPAAFDAVLMDVQMPLMDGYEATRRIRELGLSTLPIIALTADARTSERTRSLAAGMDDFVSKPFDPPVLVRCILERLELGTLRERSLPRSPPTNVATPPPAPQSTWPTVDGIDTLSAYARFVGDFDFYRALLCRFFRDYSYVARLGGLLGSTSLSEYADRMHKLRGSAAQMGAYTLDELAAQIEAACRVGDRESAVRGSERLAARFRKLQRDVQRAPQLGIPHEVWLPEQAAMKRTDLSRVAELLRAQDAAVLVEIEAVAPSLRRSLGEETYRAFIAYIECLRFPEAANALEESGDLERTAQAVHSHSA